MRKTIKFTKMQGAGNDYIYVDTSLYDLPHPGEVARLWSDRHTGIGGDGLVLIGRSPIPEADFTMRIFNADGSEAMMCGNASRCIGKYVFEKGLTSKTSIKLLTLSGIKTLKLNVSEDKHVESVTVDMLEPRFTDKGMIATPSGGMTEEAINICGQELRGTFISMGNPHFVIFVDDISTIDVARLGEALEKAPLFPQGCNIEFASPIDDEHIRTRVWERGSGITMACGTGACATAVAAALTGKANRKSTIVMDGGALEIEWSEENNHVYMSGPAKFVFEGEIEMP